MKKIVVGNWKMNPGTLKEARVIFNEIIKKSRSLKNVDVVLCPPFPFLSIGEKLKAHSTSSGRVKNVYLGAQNVFEEVSGPYTGEISPKMLSSLGVKYVILGHSERRALGDTNKTINKKVLAALKANLLPILCVGESSRDSDGFYLAFIKHQIIECLDSVPKNQIKNIIISYEPIWAISSNALHEATKEEFIEIQIFIKKVIADLYDIKTATATKIIYGGSVSPTNAKDFIDAKADGLLVGQNSLIAQKFTEIIKIAK